MAGAVYRLLSSRTYIGRVLHELSEAQAALTDLRRDKAGDAAAKMAELVAEVEAGEVRRQFYVAYLVAVGYGFLDELRLSRNKVEDFQSEMKGIWVKQRDACFVLKCYKTKLETMVQEI